jgi:uroporphyrinogen decarboxylase
MDRNSDAWKAMTFSGPRHLHARLGFLDATWMKYREDLDAVVRRHPALFGSNWSAREDYDAVGGRYVEGNHVDAWGCVWSNIRSGMWAMVTGHPLPSRHDIRNLKAPEENEGLTHGFMYQRILDLRGFEEAMLDFAEEPPELRMLIDIVFEYNLRQLDLALANVEPDTLIAMGDDLGMQDRLAIPPVKWTKYFAPCFAVFCERIKDAGSYSYLHTDGWIVDIIPDLIECGLDVLNVEAAVNGLENLVKTAKGRICLDVYPDVQRFPFFEPGDFGPHVDEIVESLSSPEGGLWVIAECTPDVPLDNIEALCGALEKHMAPANGG